MVITTCTYVEKFSAVRRHVSQLYATSEGGGGGGGGGLKLSENAIAAKCREKEIILRKCRPHDTSFVRWNKQKEKK